MLLAVLVSVSLLSTTALAFDNKNITAINSCTFSTGAQTKTMPQNMEGFNLQNVGDTHILEEDENGILYIELIEKSETVSGISRAGTKKDASKTYNVYYKNLFGQTKVAVEITSTATWVDNGAKSYIENLHGEYVVKNDDYSCAWNNEPDSVIASDFLHRLILDVYHGISTCSYSLTASLAFTDIECTQPKIIMDISNYWCG